jgi:outer membrane protein TolC
MAGYKFVTVALWAIFSMVECNADNPPENLTLQEAINAAIRNHPEIKAAGHGLRSARSGEKEMKANYLPDIGVGAASTYKTTNTMRYDLYGEASVNLFNNGRDALKLSQRKMETSYRRFLLDSKKRDLMRKVKAKYLDARYFERVVGIYDDALERNIRLGKQITKKRGKLGRYDRERLRIWRNSLMASRAEFNNSKLASYDQLRVLMGATPDFHFVLKSNIEYNPMDYDLDVLVKKGTKKNALVRFYKTRSSQFRLGGRIEGKTLAPVLDVSAKAGLLDVGNAGDGFGYNVGVSISVPVFDFGESEAQRSVEYANARRMSSLSNSAVWSMKDQLIAHLSAMKTLDEKVSLKDKNRTHANNLYKTVESRFLGNKTDSMYLVDADGVRIRESVQFYKYQFLYELEKLKLLETTGDF